MSSSKSKTKEIYLCSSLEQLNKAISSEAIENIKTAKLMHEKGQKLHKTARQIYEEGDEEQAYILYMRSAQLLMGLKLTKEYLKDDKFYRNMTDSTLRDCLTMCEVISTSLGKRYSLLELKKASDKREKDDEMKDATSSFIEENKRKTNRMSNGVGRGKNIPMSTRVADPTNGTSLKNSISNAELKSLIEQKCTTMIIIDCRGQHDYVSSHIDYPNCICIPQEILQPGVSANKIEVALKEKLPQFYFQWSQRSTYDKIVLYDWNSTFENMHKFIQTLYTAITTWDRNTAYKNSPLVLQGGFKNMYYGYPTFINHPSNAVVALAKYDETSLVNGYGGGEESKVKVAPKLGSISYPELDDDDTKAKKKREEKEKEKLKNLRPSPMPPTTTTAISGLSNQVLLPDISSLSLSSEAIKPVPVPKVAEGKNSSNNNTIPPPAPTTTPPSTSTPPPHPAAATVPVEPAIVPAPIVSKVVVDRSTKPKSTLSSSSSTSVPPQNIPTILKRSHSHPNIAQSVNEEEEEGGGDEKGKAPQFSRNLKPQSAIPSSSNNKTTSRTSWPNDIVPSRARQFHAINSTEKHRTGLKNLGNTCYMNAIIQCLVHLPGLSDYFLGDRWKEHFQINRKQKGGTNGEISAEYHAVVQEMSCGHRSIAISDFKSVVGRYHHAFRGYEQQDSHELLTILLDWMHEELNQEVKMPLKEQKNDGLSDAEAANKAWSNYIQSNRSRIVDLFCGQQKSVVRCLSCQKQSVTFDTFFNLTVPIPSSSSKKVDILQCLDLYTTEETVSGWNCPHCKSTVKATKKIDLWKLPPYLIIHLQRFYNDGWWKKRMTEVDFPVDNLDLSGKVIGQRISQDARIPRPNFMLQAVSNHYGSMDGGHYTAYCRKSSQWAKFDDQDVSQINPRDVVTPAAYILFYCNNSP